MIKTVAAALNKRVQLLFQAAKEQANRGGEQQTKGDTGTCGEVQRGPCSV